MEVWCSKQVYCQTIRSSGGRLALELWTKIILESGTMQRIILEIHPDWRAQYKEGDASQQR